MVSSFLVLQYQFEVLIESIAVAPFEKRIADLLD